MRTKQDSEWLKLIAVITMLIDHVGYMFFPKLLLFRFIGRIAFPLFAYQLAVGIKATSNPKRYRTQLGVFALLSQIPFMLAFHQTSLNVLCTFFLVIWLIMVPQLVQKGALLLLTLFIPMDYGCFGAIMVLLFYYGMEKRWTLLVSMMALTTLYDISHHMLWESFSLVGVCIIHFARFPAYRVSLPKFFFYWFYPVHLFLLWLLSLWI